MIHPLEWVKQDGLNKAHFITHMSYLTLVFKEAHGMYGIAAGALGVVIMIQASVKQYQIHTVKGKKT